MLDPAQIKIVEALHGEAMDLAEQAQIETLRSDPLGAQAVLQTALLKERNAAELLQEERTYEPTRSILFLGAASLASKCGDDQEARRLARAGLEGSPSDEVKKELSELATAKPSEEFGRQLEETGFRTRADEKDRFVSRLASIPGVHPLPSIGDWVLLQIRNPAELARRVNRRLCRGAMSVPQNVHWTVRIEVSDPTTNEQLYEALREIVA